MNVPKKYLLIGGIVLVLGVIFYLVFANFRRPGVGIQQFTLQVWGVEDEEIFSSIAGTYQAIRPGAQIVYKQLDPGTYKEEVLNALAEGNGPDVFYIKNHDIPADIDKLYPADPAWFNLAQLADLFPVVVSQDVVASGSQIYALPLYVDSLALLYNKDLFDQGAIVYPPKTWAEFQALAGKLTKLNERGQIVKSAAAIGGTEKSVDAGVDLLIALLMQNTPQITGSEEQALPEALGSFVASETLDFYVQFANSASTAYTWNDDQENSIDSFGAGKTAMILNYQSAITRIKRKSPFLNVAVSPLPQIGGETENPVTYANYYALAVSKQTLLSAWAWDFVIQATTNDFIARAYLASAGHPPALKTLISEKIGDPYLSAFAKSALIARSWHHANNQKIHDALNDAIQSVLGGRSSNREALETAVDKINQLYQ